MKSVVRYKLTNQASREGWEFSRGHSALLRRPRIISYDPFVVMKRHQSVWRRCCGPPGSQHLIETSLTDMDLEAQGLVPNKPLTAQKSQSLIWAPSPLSLSWSYQLWIRWAKWSVLAILFTPPPPFPFLANAESKSRWALGPLPAPWEEKKKKDTSHLCPQI